MNSKINLTTVYTYEFNGQRYVRFSENEWYRFIGDKSLSNVCREAPFIEKAFQTRLRKAFNDDELA